MHRDCRCLLPWRANYPALPAPDAVTLFSHVLPFPLLHAAGGCMSAMRRWRGCESSFSRRWVVTPRHRWHTRLPPASSACAAWPHRCSMLSVNIAVHHLSSRHCAVVRTQPALCSAAMKVRTSPRNRKRRRQGGRHLGECAASETTEATRLRSRFKDLTSDHATDRLSLPVSERRHSSLHSL